MSETWHRRACLARVGNLHFSSEMIIPRGYTADFLRVWGLRASTTVGAILNPTQVALFWWLSGKRLQQLEMWGDTHDVDLQTPSSILTSVTTACSIGRSCLKPSKLSANTTEWLDQCKVHMIYCNNPTWESTPIRFRQFPLPSTNIPTVTRKTEGGAYHTLFAIPKTHEWITHYDNHPSC